MGNRLYGFMIGKEIHFDINSRRLYRLPTSQSDNNLIFASVVFNDTMMNLFLYLLKYGRHNNISKEELFHNIWEVSNLSPSSQRLWQVLNNLSKKLTLIGLPRDFIINKKGRGYTVNYEDVTPIYYRVSELPTHSIKKEEKPDTLRE